MFLLSDKQSYNFVRSQLSLISILNEIALHL